MKHSYTCPKCESHDIIKVPGPASSGHARNVIPKSMFRTANVDRYLCSQCGFSEEWIKTEDIPAIRKKFGSKEKGGQDFV